MTRENILSFIVTFLLSLLIVPWIGKVTKRMGIIAHTNSRTIHKGIIPRTGGYGIYIAFLIGAMLFLKTDNQINRICNTDNPSNCNNNGNYMRNIRRNKW